MAFRLECAKDYYGPNCDVFCLVNCTADLCLGMDCGENQMCVDEILDYTCVCEPGYTGPNCTTKFDVCQGVNCNSGTCVVELDGSYACDCDPAYTGQFCETRLDGYRLQVTVHSFRNPNGMCANSYCGLNTCCDVPCPSFCNYYFSICQRSVGTPVSAIREINQGNCTPFNTISSRAIGNGMSFTNSIFGTPNPIILTGLRWVSY